MDDRTHLQLLADRYTQQVNAAVDAGRDDLADELAEQYEAERESLLRTAC